MVLVEKLINTSFFFINMAYDLNYWILRGALAIGVIIAARLIYWFINHSIHQIDCYAEDKGLSSLDISESTKKTISLISKYIIYSLAFIGVLYVFEFNDLLMGIFTAAGVTGIAVGFAAKDLISNALSGLILIFDRPFGIGDEVEIGRYVERGTVKSIGLRNTVLKSRSGMFITVPNSAVLSETVVNHSKSRTRLVEMTVEIDIDDNVKKAITLIDDMLDNLPWRYKNKSEVFIDDVNKDFVILRIKVWIASRKYGERKAELFYKIRDLLKDNNINTSILGD